MKGSFKERVLRVVARIPAGEVRSYQEIARRAGKPAAYRAVGNVLHRNGNPHIPCHRVVRADRLLGGYRLGALRKASRLLAEGCVGVMPTDTIYGIVGRAEFPETVRRIYRLRRRNPKKPMIVLIGSFDDLRRFGIRPRARTLRILTRVWPGKVSVVLPLSRRRFSYLHRGTRTLAFRLPRPMWLRRLLRETGPLVAPSANWEGWPPAVTISQARRYFGAAVEFYYDGGRRLSRPSTLMALRRGTMLVLRKGAGTLPKQFR